MPRSATHYLIGAGLLALSGTAAHAEVWQGYTFAAGEVEFGSMETTADRIREATDGAIDIHNTPAGGLPINGNDVAQAIAEDIIQFGEAGGGAVGFVPIFGISRLPGLFDNADEFATAVGILEPYYQTDFAAKGVKVLCTFLYPQQTIFSHAQITSLDQLEGLKVRVTSAEQGLVVEALGGVPVTLVSSDVPPALQQGAVDAVLTAASGGGHIWEDLLASNYRVPINWSQGFFLVNLERFQALDQATQDTVSQIAKEECTKLSASLLGSEADIVARMQANGMTITEASPEDLARVREISAPIWDEYAKTVGDEGVEAMAKIRQALNR